LLLLGFALERIAPYVLVRRQQSWTLEPDKIIEERLYDE
jgi:hypothetical protein